MCFYACDGYTVYLMFTHSIALYWFMPSLQRICACIINFQWDWMKNNKVKPNNKRQDNTMLHRAEGNCSYLSFHHQKQQLSHYRQTSDLFVPIKYWYVQLRINKSCCIWTENALFCLWNFRVNDNIIPVTIRWFIWAHNQFLFLWLKGPWSQSTSSPNYHNLCWE